MEPTAHCMIYDFQLIILPPYAAMLVALVARLFSAAAYLAQSANCSSVLVAMAYLVPDEAQDVPGTAAPNAGGFSHPGCT